MSLPTMFRRSLALFAPLALFAAVACGPEPGSTSADSTSRSFTSPEEGSCEALAMLKVANESDFDTLDDDVKLDRRAAQGIVDLRPFDRLEDLDATPYVGQAALGRIYEYANGLGYLDACNDGGSGGAGGGAGGASPVEPSGEIGILSDLDKTVVPPANPDLSKAPYPGVTRLYQILELGSDGGGVAGDMYYVTARQPDSVTEIPAYLEDHGVPAGPIETGVSGIPWVAQPEKVRDISKVLDGTGEQVFLLFGDSSHRDPEAYQEIIELYPNRITAGFIHKVNNTVSPHRVEGLFLHESYCEVAAILYGLEVLTREQALEVMQAAQAEGEDITATEMEALLDAQMN